MRFNDVTQTILAVEERTGLAATTLWRQCVDVLAQYDQPGKVMLKQEDRVALVSRLHDLRVSLSETQRIASVVELGRHVRSPALIEFFASDRPAVCAAAMARAQLPDALWPVLLPRLSPTARGVLRGRKDIGEHTRRALEAFGSTDLVLANAVAALPDEDAFVLSPEAASQSGPAQADPAQADPAQAQTDAVRLVSIVPPEGSTGQQEHIVDGEERSQIRQLVERIEHFTSSVRDKGRSFQFGEEAGATAAGAADQAPEQAGEQALDQFPFETDSEGTLIWVGEASRTALVGLNIAQPALPGATGPDGHVAGAFARRSSFQHGRLAIGEGLYQGEWRLSAIPFFDPATGRFQGYRGQARRPLVHEMPHRAVSATKEIVQGPAPTLDSMRQIIHELRTPLNAILGFAEIIEQQLFGPAGAHYREMAGNILSDARRLMSAFEDIDLAARSAAMQDMEPSVRPRADAVDIEELLERVAGLYNGDAEDGVARLHIAASAHIPLAYMEPVQGERMIQHLVRTLVSVAGKGEAVQGAIWFQPEGQTGKIAIGFDRPVRLHGLDEQEILDPGYGKDGDWPDGPLLGLGFSMRLVRSLAQSQGGLLRIEQDRIVLELPAAEQVFEHEAGETSKN